MKNLMSQTWLVDYLNILLCIYIVCVFCTQLFGHLCGDVFLLAKPAVHAYYGVAYTPVVDTIPKSPSIVITQWHRL